MAKLHIMGPFMIRCSMHSLIMVKLDPIPFGQLEVQQHLLVHLNEGGLEDQLASSPHNKADGHNALSDHLGVVVHGVQACLQLPLCRLQVCGDPEPCHPLEQPLKGCL